MILQKYIPADLPEVIRTARASALKDLGVSAEDWKALAEAVMALSDFYVKHPEKSSPWDETWAQIAYVAYYMPLNWWRLCGVVGRGQELNYFDGFEHYVDFGSGLGSLGFAFDQAGIGFKSGLAVERSREAVYLHRQLAQASMTPIDWQSNVKSGQIKAKTLGVFSYSFTELKALPEWVQACDGLLIVEPSTKDDARRLQAVRGDLLASGWHVWGPCTHAAPCPLLTHGERDWCHDRFQWSQPDWLKKIEARMPIKNGTLPCSWLMVRRDPPPPRDSTVARMTGDLQEFKGFAKQLICRGADREFVAWQKKDFKKGYPEIGRGDLVRVKKDLPMKAQELRPSLAADVARLN